MVVNISRSLMLDAQPMLCLSLLITFTAPMLEIPGLLPVSRARPRNLARTTSLKTQSSSKESKRQVELSASDGSMAVSIFLAPLATTNTRQIAA